MTARPMTPQMQVWIDQSQGMVRAIATRIYSTLPRSVSYEDLVAYGQLGLVQAAHAFDESREASFQTYAYHRIRGAIYDGLSQMSWTDRTLRMRIRAERLSAEMLDEQIAVNRRMTNQDALAADADWLVQTTEKIAVIHLLGDCSGESSGIEGLAVDHTTLPAQEVADNEMRQLVRSLVEQLPDEERCMVEMTYFEGKTLTEAAEKLGKSKSWASRLHARILEKLARKLAAQGAA